MIADLDLEEVQADSVSLVRPYTLTRGRTRCDGVDVPIHGVVDHAPGVERPARLTPVSHQIWASAAGGISPAELSAQLDLPVGVIRVLVGDLVTDGCLRLGQTPAVGDAALVRRLIDGVRAL